MLSLGYTANSNAEIIALRRKNLKQERRVPKDIQTDRDKEQSYIPFHQLLFFADFAS